MTRTPETETSRNADNLTGKILIAMPGMADPRFSHSVVLDCAHGAEGAMGIVLNKPLPDIAFAELLDQLRVRDSEGRRLLDHAGIEGGDPLAGGDAEVDLPQDRLLSSGRSPGEPADGDGAVRGPAGGVGDQTALRSRTSWPGGKGLSAPASASARVSSHPPMPAMTTPETTMRGR